MSVTDAVAFLERLETDEGFAAEVESVRDRPNAVIEKVRAAGFDTDPEEIQEAFNERYGAELTQEQLDQIAAGTRSVDSPEVIAALSTIGAMAVALAASAAV